MRMEDIYIYITSIAPPPSPRRCIIMEALCELTNEHLMKQWFFTRLFVSILRQAADQQILCRCRSYISPSCCIPLIISGTPLYSDMSVAISDPSKFWKTEFWMLVCGCKPELASRMRIPIQHGKAFNFSERNFPKTRASSTKWERCSWQRHLVPM